MDYLKLTNKENLQETLERLYEMSNLCKSDTNLPVNLWLDESGEDRKIEHNSPRIKFQNDNDGSLIPISISENPMILLKDPPIIHSKIINSIKSFIIHNRDILEKHYIRQIKTKQIYSRLRIRGYYSFPNALEIIPQKSKNLISEDEIRQEFSRIINKVNRRRAGLLEERMNKNELYDFLLVFFDNEIDCMNAITDYDNRAF